MSFLDKYTFEILLVITLLVFLLLLYWIITHYRKVHYTEKSKLLLAKGFIDYDYKLNVFSNDGKKWYYVYFFQTKAPRVLARFKPNLSRKEAWQRVVNYVYSKGPISYEDETGIRLLLGVGFNEGDHDTLTDQDFKKNKPL